MDTPNPSAENTSPIEGISETASTQAQPPMAVVIKKILVPLDPRDQPSLKAITYAIALARVFGAEVTLLNVVEEPALPRFLTSDDEERQEKLTAEANLLVSEIYNREVAPHVKGQYLIRHGRSCPMIVQVAEEIHADLIVILTHSLKGLAQFINACTAETVVKDARCPVLVVKEHEHEFVVPEGSTPPGAIS